MRSTAVISTLADVINNVVALFGAVGDARSPGKLASAGGVALLQGERYLPMSSNDAPPRIVFVQTEDEGAMGGVPRIGAGYIGSITEPVVCYVWGEIQAPAWQASTTVRSGINRANGGNVYRSVKSGETAASGGPLGTGQGIDDGDAAWDFISAAPPFDASREDVAMQLVVRLINAFRRAAPGRIRTTKIERAQDPNGEGYGENYRLHITYTWGVPLDRAIWEVPVIAISPPDVMRPEGDNGLTYTLTPTVVGDRS